MTIGATVAKERVTVSLDADLVGMLRSADANVSSAVNDAVRAALERATRHRALGELLDEWDAQHGPPSEDDFAAVDALLAEAGAATRRHRPVHGEAGRRDPARS